jgi:hypothetical protein
LKCASAVSSSANERSLGIDARTATIESGTRVRLVEPEVIQEPDLRRIAELRPGARHVEISRPERREHDVLHGLERRAHEQHHTIAFRPHEHAHGDVARHFVRVRGGEQRQRRQRNQWIQAPHLVVKPRPALGNAPISAIIQAENKP